MSVINNVLKDLEARESGFAQIEIPDLDGRIESRSVWKPLLLVMLVLVPVVALGGYYWQSRGESNAIAAVESESVVVAEVQPVIVTDVSMVEVEPVQAEAETAETVAMVAVEPQPAEVAPRNQIIGLQMREADAVMHLEFALREQVIAYVTERSETSFAYHLREIDNQIAAPVLRDNRWLHSLEITPSGDGVDIRFQTAANVLVETRQHQGEDGRIWSIGFRQSEPEPVVTAMVTPAPLESPNEVEEMVEVPIETEQPVVSRSEPEAAIEAETEVKLDIRTRNPDATETNRLKYALELINSGRHADAERLLQSLINGSEDHAARIHLLALYGHQNRQDRLARLAQDSLTRYPGDEIFVTEFARSRYQAKAYKTALEILASIQYLNADQHALAAASHQRLEHHERAIEHYRKALNLDAGNAKNWVGLGISQEHTAELESALQSYQNATKLGVLNGRLQAFVDKRSETLRQVLN